MLRSSAAVLALLVSGCAIDTALGIEGTIEAASVDVSAGASGDVVRATVDVDYRVGEYAEGTRQFMPSSIQLFVAGSAVAQMPPEATDFTSTLAPGDSASATFTGETTTATDPRRLCGAAATVLFRWVDRATSETGMAEGTTSDVTCD
jgi:hypothetical protein